jgi:dimethylhistidine N-methyltransferase
MITQQQTMLEEVVEGLCAPQKSISPKYFYDERGSQLFDEICELPEYYPTRIETEILCRHAPAMAQHLGKELWLIEPGSGSSNKTRIVLDALHAPQGYVPVDISCEHLRHHAAQLQHDYSSLQVVPLCADYSQGLRLPEELQGATNKAVFFPGSTIGNFDHEEATAFLRQVAQMLGVGGSLLIGVDLQKDVQVLECAYNDARGVTAQFNLNVLARLNRELNANFQLDNFQHLAFYNQSVGRIEMHLQSVVAHEVQIANTTITFKAGETIHTENSYKYTLTEFAQLAARGSFAVEKVWTDEDQWFSVQLLRCERIEYSDMD